MENNNLNLEKQLNLNTQQIVENVFEGQNFNEKQKEVKENLNKISVKEKIKNDEEIKNEGRNFNNEFKNEEEIKEETRKELEKVEEEKAEKRKEEEKKIKMKQEENLNNIINNNNKEINNKEEIIKQIKKNYEEIEELKREIKLKLLEEKINESFLISEKEKNQKTLKYKLFLINYVCEEKQKDESIFKNIKIKIDYKLQGNEAYAKIMKEFGCYEELLKQSSFMCDVLSKHEEDEDSLKEIFKYLNMVKKDLKETKENLEIQIEKLKQIVSKMDDFYDLINISNFGNGFKDFNKFNSFEDGDVSNYFLSYFNLGGGNLLRAKYRLEENLEDIEWHKKK